MLPKRLASAPFGDTKRCPGVKHVGRTKLRAESLRRRLQQDELFQCQIRYLPAQPGDLGFKLGQILGQIALEASVPISPPIVSYFGYADFPHTLRNPSATGDQSFDMSQLCNDFLGLMSSHHRPPFLKELHCHRFAALAFASYLSPCGARPQRIIKAPRRIFIASESHAYAARLKNTPSLAIGSLDASVAARATQRHIDSRVSGSANTNDLVSGNCEGIRIAVTTASHTPDGPCATGRPNVGAYDGADGERGGAADGRAAATDGWRRLEP